MIGYAKSAQIGKKVNPKKRKRNGKKMSRVYEWQQARARLKLEYQSHKIKKCEYTDDDTKRCNSTFALSFAHRKKRRDLEPGDLGSINETLLLCQDHHQTIESNEHETTRLFELLRPI